jgi:hypothetical protein
VELTNHTPYPAMLFRGYMGDDLFVASLAVRVTYDLVDGAAVPSAEQTWPVSPGPWECEYGPMDGDELHYRGGVDLFVFGHARAPKGCKVTESEVLIEVGGSFRRRIAVLGDRVWQKQDGKLLPSRPQPFSAMALTPQNAYGGKDQWDGLEAPYAENPDGKGYVLEEEDVEGKPLPNLEDPGHLIAKWDDRPEPACVTACSMLSPLRVRNGLEMDDEGGLKRLKPEFFNAAFPRMIVNQVEPGDVVKLTGMTEGGPIAFQVPATRFAIRLCFDNEVHEKPLKLDQIGVEADKARVFASFRYPFRYVFYPMQRRSCELFEATARPA